MSLVINRVLTLPATPVANSIYLVGKSATELQLVVVGNSPSDIRATIVGSDVDTKISTAIAGLDMSNTALFAADIAARDALKTTLTKNSFVFVADASADPTTGSGSAMYFFHTTDQSFTKVADYKSMDIDIAGMIESHINAAFPNKTDLQAIGHDTDGNLTFKGAVVGTVQAGSTAW